MASGRKVGGDCAGFKARAASVVSGACTCPTRMGMAAQAGYSYVPGAASTSVRRALMAV